MWRLLRGREGFSAGSPEKPSRPVFDLVEAGAGNVRLSLVEQSAAARAAQPDVLRPHAARLHQSCSTLAGLPHNVNGAIFANELLDALPTHAVAMGPDGLREVFVDYRDGRFSEVLTT